MGLISIQKLCFLLLLILLTCYYTNAFRLIHTSQQTHDTKLKPEHKESVSKIEEVQDEIMSFKEKYKNHTMKLQQKSVESETKVKTKIISEKKVKPVQPTLPDISKDKILRTETKKPESEVKESKPVIPKEQPERKRVIKIQVPKPKDPSEDKKKEEPLKKEKLSSVKPKEEKIEPKKSKDEKKIETTKSKEEKIIEAMKAKEEKKLEIKKPKEEIKVEIKKPKEEKKVQIPKPKEEAKLEVTKPKDQKKVETAKAKEIKKTDQKLEVKPKEIKKSDQKLDVKPKQTKEPVKKESPKPMKQEEPKIVIKDWDSSISSLYFNLPSFSPNFDVVENEECKKQGQILIDQLNKHKLWALKMFDATAKIPSGILKGNLNQLGDYDQCVGIFTKISIDEKEPDVKIAGKYCLANIDLEAEIQEMKLPVHLAQSRALIRSRIQDPGHFIPRFTTIRWGLCIPSGCSAEDAERIFEDSIKSYNESSSIGIHFDVSVDADDCYVRKPSKNISDFEYTTLASLSLAAAIGLLVLFATLRDVQLLQINNNEDEAPEIHVPGKLEKILMAFSLKSTTASLLRYDSDPEEIECIHGIRTICTFILYIAHKLIPIGHVPYSNKTTLTELSNNPLSVILRLSVIYTDSFLLLSGILTAYSMSKDMEEKGGISWFSRILTRFIRLTPSLLVVLLYYAYVMELVGDGPLWGTVITSNAELCKESWWKNLLYIQNFYPFQEMCATHTHQLALDMQLSLLAPVLVWLLYRKPLLGVCTTILLHSISVILRYYTTMNYRLSLVIYHGISISQLYRTGNLLYISAIYRLTPYVAGIGLGVLLRQLKSNFEMPKILLFLGWLIAGYFASWTLYTPSHLSSRTYKYDINEAAQFSALCSLAWALALSWLIFYCFADKQGYINSFLSSRPMIVLSRISYTLYLTQFIVFFYNVGTVRSSEEFKLHSSVDFIEIVFNIIIATLLTLLVDMPVQKIKNILLKSAPNKENSESEKDNNEEVSNKIENITDNVKKVTISDNIEILDGDDETDSKYKYRQLSTESEPVSEDYTEDTEDLLDEDEEIVKNLEYKMRQYSTESESEPLSEETEQLLNDEEIVQHLEKEYRQPSFESQPSLEDVEDISDEEMDDNLIRQSQFKSQYSTEDIEEILDEEEMENVKSKTFIKAQYSTEDIDKENKVEIIKREASIQAQYSTEGIEEATEIETMEENPQKLTTETTESGETRKNIDMQEHVKDAPIQSSIKTQDSQDNSEKIIDLKNLERQQEMKAIEETKSEQEIEKNIEKLSPKSNEDTEKEEATIEKFVFRIRPTRIRKEFKEEESKTAKEDEDIVRKLENNIRKSTESKSLPKSDNE